MGFISAHIFIFIFVEKTEPWFRSGEFTIGLWALSKFVFGSIQVSPWEVSFMLWKYQQSARAKCKQKV